MDIILRIALRTAFGTLVLLACVPRSAAIDLTLRTRDSASRILTTKESIDPAKTGVVIIDSGTPTIV